MYKQVTTISLIAIIFIMHLFTVKGYALNIKSTAPVITSEVVNAYPHDETAYTQGFLYHDNAFYESTGKHGRSSIRRIEQESGTVSTEIKIDSKFFGEGLCIWNNKIFQLTWKSEKCLVYDTRSLARTASFKYKGQGWGLTTDGDFLIQSNGTNTLTFRDPYDFAKITTLKITDGSKKVFRINELEYVKGLILCNIWFKDKIGAIDKTTGKIKFWIDISNLRPLAGKKAEAANGIAWDAENHRLFVTGKFWNKVFEIKLPELQQAPSTS
ncbi:MAG: glutamine cyclotransferase [Desulfovibrio sp. S3730MH75]|nr:MAG: glutamine cyclotransferase [Desulfovibrio sp. S3730MH75]